MSDDTTLDDYAESNSDRLTNENWRTYTLGDLAEYQNGNAFNKDEWVDEGYPIIRIQNLTGEQDEFNYYDGELDEIYRVQSGDILLSWSATIDVFQWQGSDAALNQHIFRVDTSESINDTFYRFKLESLLPKLRALSHGSTMKHVRKADLVNLDTEIPPLSEQRKIATVLDTIDQAIQKTERIIERIERLHTSLRRDLIISGIEHQEFQEMRIGPFEYKIPVEWEVVSISEACTNLDKDRIPVKQSKREEMEGNIPYYGASGIIDYVDDYLFEDDLILLAEDGENLKARNSPISFKISGKAWVNNHAHVLKPREEFEIDYLVEYFERLNYEPFVTGSAQPKLTQANMEMLSVPKPPKSEQAEIASALTSISEYRDKAEQNISRLQQLKEGLMQDLLSGELRMSETDIDVPEEVAKYG